MSVIEILIHSATLVTSVSLGIYFIFFQARRDNITYSMWDYLFRKPPYPERPYWVITLSRAVLVVIAVVLLTSPMLIIALLDGYR